LPVAADPPWREIVGVAEDVRTGRAGTQSFLAEARTAVWSVNSSLPVFLMSTMKDLYHRSLAATSFTLVMLAIAGTMALLLGIVGIYGVMSYAVSQRMREMGSPCCGWLAAAAGLTRLMKSLLVGIRTLDPVIYAAMPSSWSQPGSWRIICRSGVPLGPIPARPCAWNSHRFIG
jgi:hypothetical protein